MAGEYNTDTFTFITSIFTASCLPPFSIRFDLEGDPEQLRSFLSCFIVTGADIKFKKELSQLNKQELNILRDYMLSIGYDADYNLIQKGKLILDYKPTGQPFTKKISYDEWQITFKIARS